MELEVREGDIAAVEADAVANAANDHLWMGAGVAGALKRAGGATKEGNGFRYLETKKHKLGHHLRHV